MIKNFYYRYLFGSKFIRIIWRRLPIFLKRLIYDRLLRRFLNNDGIPKELLQQEKSEEFNAKVYLALNPDVAAVGCDPFDHYLRSGRSEGRVCSLPDINFSSLDPVKETIVIVSHEGSRSGAPILSYNIIAQLVKTYNVIAFFLGPGPLVNESEKLGAVIIRCERRWSETIYPLILKEITANLPIKFAIVNSIESRSTLRAFACEFIPTVLLIHEFAAYTRPYGAFKEAITWADNTVFSTTITRDNAIEEYPELAEQDFLIIPQGRCLLPGQGEESKVVIDELKRIQSAMRPYDFAENGLVIMGAGSVQYRKGVDLFIASAEKILRSKPDVPVRFVWVGHGYDPQMDSSYSVYLKDQIQRSGLDQDFVFLDEVTDLSSVYDSADMMLLTARLDPLPNVAIDALVEGLPVLCFDNTTGIADFLKSSELGDSCVARYLDTEDIAQKMLELINDWDLRKSISSKSALLSAKAFNIQDYVAKLDKLAQSTTAIEQRQADRHSILQSQLIDIDYFTSPGMRYSSDEEAIEHYLRAWASEYCRKLFPGFVPGVYAALHGCENPHADPLADYIRSGKPEGPWNTELITDSEAKKIKTVPVAANFRIGLHIHAYYPDLLIPIIERLNANVIRPDLMVSVSDDKAKFYVMEVLQGYPASVDVKVMPNKGRDIGPFLTGFAKEIKSNYDFIGHIHTKKTADLDDASVGKRWFNFNLENLLGSEHAKMADAILARMTSDTNIGMVFPDDPYQMSWGENKKHAEKLLEPLGLTALPEQVLCPVGTMFWASVSALKPFLNLGLTWNDYPEEPLPYDGTILHAIERLLPVPLINNGQKIMMTNVSKVTR